MWRRTALFLLFTLPVAAQSALPWTLARSEHFEIYAQAGEAAARSALLWFEALRQFFVNRALLKPDGRPPVRVIGFRSEREYNGYRLRPTADAYYAGLENQDYIVMPSFDPAQFSVAAHEYAHVVLHAHALELPSWLSEGLAEVFSTLRLEKDGRWGFGAEIKAHVQLLRRRSPMPLPALFQWRDDSLLNQDRAATSLFYAESWALVEMLVFSPGYNAQFPQLMQAIGSGVPEAVAFEQAYGKTLDAAFHDLATFLGRHSLSPSPLPDIDPAVVVSARVSSEPPSKALSLIGEIFLATGDLGRAEQVFDASLESERDRAGSLAALGTLALMRGDRGSAHRQWASALAAGVDNAPLCYRYAQLAQTVGVSADEIRPVLERAIAVEPDFDDARFALALLENNAGNHEAAVNCLRNMRVIKPGRAFGYWNAMAYALNELHQRKEAEAAARQAELCATNDHDRAIARQQAYVARTDLTVQFTRDAAGREQLTTTRIPHGTANWNPFVETGDRLERVEASLDAVECAGAETTIIIKTASQRLRLAIADPNRVQMRNSPAQLTCGTQSGAHVFVEYAASSASSSDVAGVVRGIEFRQ